MVAPSLGISDGFQADYQKGCAQTYPPDKSVLNAFGASREGLADLFGKIEEIPKCLNCGKPLPQARPNKRYCNAFCRDEHFHKREAAAKLAVSDAREQEAMAWAKDNQTVIYHIVCEAQFSSGNPKMSFRRFWEDARAAYPDITFDNNHSRFVSRYIMDTYPELAGAFRTRN